MDERILTKQEFADRIARAQAAIAPTDLDAVLVFSTESEPAGVRYFSDYWPSFETAGVLIPRSGEAALIIGPESLTFATSRSVLPNVIQVMDFRESSQPDYPGSAHPDWKTILKKYGVKKLGITGFHMFPYTIMMNVIDALGGIDKIVDADALLRPVTMKKSPLELECLRKAAKISELGFKAILENIIPGMTEVELCGIATQAMLSNGAEATGYPVWCCSGPNSNQAISRPRQKVIKEGDLTFLQIGARYEGYASSIGRAVVFGKATDEQRKLIEAGYKLQETVLGFAKAGVPARDVAKLHLETVKKLGYEDHYLYGPFHGNGLMEGEAPWVEVDSDYILQENMTFCCDLFLGSHETKRGIRIEDVIRITKDGVENLTNFPCEIFEIQ